MDFTKYRWNTNTLYLDFWEPWNVPGNSLHPEQQSHNASELALPFALFFVIDFVLYHSLFLSKEICSSTFFRGSDFQSLPETAFHLKECFPSAARSCLRCFLSENPLSCAAAVFHVVAVPHFWVLSDNVESRSRKTSWSFAVSTSFRTMFHVLFHRSVCNWSAVP